LLLVAIVTDPTRVIEAFENHFVLNVKGPASKKPGSKTRRRSTSEENGENQEGPAGFALPDIAEVYESHWDNYDPPFNKYTALRIRHSGRPKSSDGAGNGEDIYDFFVNMDNVYLKSELKSVGKEIEVIHARFKTGMVLLGLALLREDTGKRRASQGEGQIAQEEVDLEGNVEDYVEQVSKAFAPVLLPMIESLGSLDIEGGLDIVASGEAS
jgi:hypothetical protein